MDFQFLNIFLPLYLCFSLSSNHFGDFTLSIVIIFTFNQILNSSWAHKVPLKLFFVSCKYLSTAEDWLSLKIVLVSLGENGLWFFQDAPYLHYLSAMSSSSTTSNISGLCTSDDDGKKTRHMKDTDKIISFSTTMNKVRPVEEDSGLTRCVSKQIVSLMFVSSAAGS